MLRKMGGHRWTIERIYQEAERHGCLGSWIKTRSYKAACKRQIADEICNKMGWIRKVKRHTDKALIDHAKQFKSFAEWRQSAIMHRIARGRHLDKQICEIMGWLPREEQPDSKDYKKEFEVGEIVGKLEILQEIESRYYGANGRMRARRFQCRCLQCNEITEIFRNQIIKRKGRDGCKKCAFRKSGLSTRKSPGGAGFSKLLGVYVKGAKIRGLPFELTKDQFAALTKQPCHFCGSLPSQTIRSYNRNQTEEAKAFGQYTYNGIDRLDNNLGYLVDNCVPCCATCNRMKTAHTLDFFLARIAKLYAHLKESSLLP